MIYDNDIVCSIEKTDDGYIVVNTNTNTKSKAKSLQLNKNNVA